MRLLQTAQVPIWVATSMFLALSGCGKSTTGSLPDGAVPSDAPASTGGSPGGSGGTATSGAGGVGGSSKGSGGAGGSMSGSTGGSPGSGGNVIGGTKGTGGISSAGGISGTDGRHQCGTGANCMADCATCSCLCEGGVGGAPGTGGATGTGGISGTGGNQDLCYGKNHATCYPYCFGGSCDCVCEGGSGGTPGMGGWAGTGGTGGAGGGSAKGGAPGVDGAAGTGGTSGAIDGGVSACQIIDALDRSCTVDADCVAVKHTSNCCGQIRYIGIRATEANRFAANEPACDASYPACGCASRSPFMDDGSVDNRPTVQAGVTCQLGTCTTFVHDCGKPCASGTTCFSCSNHAQLFAACTLPCASGVACPSSLNLPLCQTGSSGNVSGTFCTAAGVACNTN
jgi:hypothetical protein